MGEGIAGTERGFPFPVATESANGVRQTTESTLKHET
jgi:hypothetical protein